MKQLISRILAAFMALTLIAAPVACTAAKQAATTAEAGVIDCAHKDLGTSWSSAAGSVLLFVISVLADGGTDWQKDLDAVGAKFGPDVVACAASVAEQIFRGLGAPSPDGSGSASTGMVINGPHERAQQALAKYAAGKKVQ